MLSNAYFLAKFRFDTAENEPAKNLQNQFAKFANFRPATSWSTCTPSTRRSSPAARASRRCRAARRAGRSSGARARRCECRRTPSSRFFDEFILSFRISSEFFEITLQDILIYLVIVENFIQGTLNVYSSKELLEVADIPRCF